MTLTAKIVTLILVVIGFLYPKMNLVKFILLLAVILLIAFVTPSTNSNPSYEAKWNHLETSMQNMQERVNRIETYLDAGKTNTIAIPPQ